MEVICYLCFFYIVEYHTLGRLVNLYKFMYSATIWKNRKWEDSFLSNHFADLRIHAVSSIQKRWLHRSWALPLKLSWHGKFWVYLKVIWGRSVLTVWILQVKCLGNKKHSISIKPEYRYMEVSLFFFLGAYGSKPLISLRTFLIYTKWNKFHPLQMTWKWFFIVYFPYNHTCKALHPAFHTTMQIYDLFHIIVCPEEITSWFVSSSRETYLAL